MAIPKRDVTTVSMRVIVSALMFSIALLLFVTGMSQYQGPNWDIARGAYVSAAGIVAALALLPWAMK